MITLADLKADICRFPDKSPEYVAKMLHDLPDCPEVDRIEYILGHVRGKKVLDIGATGALHEAIVREAEWCWGISRESSPGVAGFDLDDIPEEAPYGHWPDYGDLVKPFDIVIVGEVLEHLSNPGYFLNRLIARYQVPAIFSVPNAFSSIAQRWAAKGIDNCNLDHVAWHSPKTLETLLSRAGYTIAEWACYNGTAPFAEGWIVRCEA